MTGVGPGTPGAGAGAGQAGRGGAPVGGRGGMGGVMGGAGAGRGKDDDKDHKKKYGLTSDEHVAPETDEHGRLHDPRTGMPVVPPVIGERDPRNNR